MVEQKEEIASNKVTSQGSAHVEHTHGAHTEHRRRPSSPGTEMSEDLGNPWKEDRKYLGEKELGYWMDKGALDVFSCPWMWLPCI